MSMSEREERTQERQLTMKNAAVTLFPEFEKCSPEDVVDSMLGRGWEYDILFHEWYPFSEGLRNGELDRLLFSKDTPPTLEAFNAALQKACLEAVSRKANRTTQDIILELLGIHGYFSTPSEE